MGGRELRIVRVHVHRECFCLGIALGERLRRRTCVGLRAMRSMLLSGLRERNIMTSEFQGFASKSGSAVGRGQYRNAVASGECCNCNNSLVNEAQRPTRRYRVTVLTSSNSDFEAKPSLRMGQD